MISDEMLSGLVTAYNGTVEIVQRDRVEPQRSSERKPIEKSWRLADAKAELMRRYGIAEPVAHTMLQRLAMECRMPLDEASDIIRLGLMALDHLRADHVE